MITHANCVFSGAQKAAAMELTADDRLLSALPIFHVNAQSALLAALTAGAPFVLTERYSASRYCEQLAAHGTTVTSLVGTQVRTMLRQEPRAADRAPRHAPRLVRAERERGRAHRVRGALRHPPLQRLRPDRGVHLGHAGAAARAGLLPGRRRAAARPHGARRCRRRRGRRDPGRRRARPDDHGRLLERPRGDRRHDPRWLAAHGRSRPARRGRLPALRRAQGAHDQARRREHRRGRGRAGSAGAPGRGRGRRRRRARRDPRRGRQGRRRARPGSDGDRRGARGALRRAPGAVQGADALVAARGAAAQLAGEDRIPPPARRGGRGDGGWSCE